MALPSWIIMLMFKYISGSVFTKLSQPGSLLRVYHCPQWQEVLSFPVSPAPVFARKHRKFKLC